MIRAKCIASPAWAGLALVLVAASLASAADEGKNVILIGWDGAQRNHVKEMLEKGQLPVLTSLAKEGTMVDIDVVTGATDTKAGWTQILTGYAPDKSGVFSNSRYQPIPVGYTILERVEQALGKDSVVTMTMIGKAGHVDADPPRKVPYEQYEKQLQKAKQSEKKSRGIADLAKGQVVEENGQKYILVPGKPYFNMKDRIDSWTNGLKTNEAVGTMALENLEKNKDKRFLFFVHFAEPDHSGHAHGENSKEYSDALASDDQWTGSILDKLKQLGIYEKTLVYVVVDHGFNEDTSGHSYAPFVFLATNDKKVNRNGAREDIGPTVLKRFGVDLAKLEPKLDGVPLDEAAPERKAPEEKPGAKPGAKKPRAKAGAKKVKPAA